MTPYPNIKDLSFQQFEAYLAERKEPVYRARQIWQWLFQKQAATFSVMTNLPSAWRARLAEDFSISRLDVLKTKTSADGTTKFLWGLSDGESMESVLIPESKRLTLCISTQVGCGFGCAFCATAILGLKRSLRASEIVDQVLDVNRSLVGGQRISHVVFMGMGEPLAN
ncbi:MAG: 23S rRNA (adenine(2503)-C(2))-methyltransferase RlmN, partial [Candidatus Binatia bacterium]